MLQNCEQPSKYTAAEAKFNFFLWPDCFSFDINLTSDGMKVAKV